MYVIPLDFRVLMLSIIVQLNFFGELRSYKELFETSWTFGTIDCV